ncbi:high affinity cGMP-specific 3',5'-cyclic phosphodiesterase 9A-like [Folsomia candida]|uniref:high affinity cGMP-specific 3',5'-cyclic phosphodiesterase 9A-like n=1 Tax=Folsomia candida TaxID=158441 RepID=UPI001604CBB5|nr:high affinity cGMP-specific 3',5'-cyclic phosphodiesterase 9A-like [Folsomia candida]XP_035704927.1 high affinity cGMP-specific 3',5'-cyclic phosphodiesterase 9A-like [Folsomia candida]XP_035704928.1 high affinity cGMP-specific 3',5'-cyclic phosphodiesterase 9A-like [Folsomia candida]
MASGQGSSLDGASPAEEESSSRPPPSEKSDTEVDEEEATTTVYFLVGDRHKAAIVPKNSSSDDIKDMFRSASEAGTCDIVKLYTPEGRLINITPNIPPNEPTNPYRLEVVAVHYNAILMEQVGIDLLSFEARVSTLERIFKQQTSPLESIHGLKDEVNQLRHLIQNYEHLSWLGFYKALHPPALPPPSETPVRSFGGHGYHRKSKAEKQVICDKFLKLSDVVLTKETCQLLREPTFDNWQWDDEEMLVLLQQMYLDLELPKKFDIEISILRNFLVHVYHHYNDVPFHNFRHCFMVTQMMFGMACYVNLPEKIGDLETLILITSCICHDLDHPGYNNIYQINAQTELALRYNDISPLENHHCSIAFRLFEDPNCNIFRNLPPESYKRIREGMIRCILATDMARHNEIVNQFREIVPYFDRNNKTHVNLLTMVLIKVADISNEARPMDIAEPWLDCLFAEFFQQSDTEKLEGLPVTPFMDREKVTKPSSQCSFISLVLLPLFEALASLYPELEPIIIQPVKDALDYYRRLNEASQQARHRKSTTDQASVFHATTSGGGIPATTSTSTSSHALANVCDKVPSESGSTSKNKDRALSITAVSTDLLVGGTDELPPISPPPAPMQSRHSNPMSYRRASQLLMLKASGSSTSLKSGQAQRSASSNFQSFPSLDSDTEREGGDESDQDEEAITEVAVSEKALKFKIATEPSFDFSTSRKGSRENKSESSIHSNQAAKDDRISYDTSIASEVPKVDIIPKVAVSGFGSPAKEGSSTSEVPSSTKSKAAKDSFFKRLKLFTERLSISVESASGGSAAGSGGESPSSSSYKAQSKGFHYFRSPAKKERAKRQETLGIDACSSDSKAVGSRRHGKHRGSNSDPESSQSPSNFVRRLHHPEVVQSEGERDDSQVASPDYSPALSVASGSENKAYWKPCSGSLDSILSKDEVKRSPARRLMLPRFSSFVQRKTRMGFMSRSSSRKPDNNQS